MSKIKNQFWANDMKKYQAKQDFRQQTKSTRQMYAEAHALENKERGLCPHCGSYCDGDCQSN